MPQSTTTDLIVQSLHVSRFGTYARAAGGDMKLALRLYLWNLDLAAAFHSCLSVTEVLLRNAMDAQLRTWNAAQARADGGTFPAEWLDDAAKPLHSLTSGARSTARVNAGKARAARPTEHPRKHEPITHDDVLAQLTFGVFVRLLPTTDVDDKTHRGRQVLWDEALAQAFPGAKDDPEGKIIASRVGRIHALRNRVAHMEPLLEVNVKARHRDMIQIVGAIDPRLQGWFASVSQLHEVVRRRPTT
ncbi:hypothetical protein [Xylanimonas protaetiae]|uniref:Abi family protein n=1 Tax=Xylanimonas protaetiae TaxID=2509457 RepID=A0A4P6FAP1_9MICO|nr:hypothetical protein [Xylanimonas protaetiae]QAY70477.1 hypothetical protein ET471_10920 [Xylanimonas protaetiae]